MEAVRAFKNGYGAQAPVDVIDVNAASQEYDADEMTGGRRALRSRGLGSTRGSSETF